MTEYESDSKKIYAQRVQENDTSKGTSSNRDYASNVTEYESDQKYAQRVQEYDTSKGTSSNRDHACNVSEYRTQDDGEYTAYEPTEEERTVNRNIVILFFTTSIYFALEKFWRCKKRNESVKIW